MNRLSIVVSLCVFGLRAAPADVLSATNRQEWSFPLVWQPDVLPPAAVHRAVMEPICRSVAGQEKIWFVDLVSNERYGVDFDLRFTVYLKPDALTSRLANGRSMTVSTTTRYPLPPERATGLGVHHYCCVSSPGDVFPEVDWVPDRPTDTMFATNGPGLLWEPHCIDWIGIDSLSSIHGDWRITRVSFNNMDTCTVTLWCRSMVEGQTVVLNRGAQDWEVVTTSTFCVIW